MSVAHHNRPASGLVVRLFGTLRHCRMGHLAGRLVDDTGDMIANLKGEVHIEVRGSSTSLRSGSVLELPATPDVMVRRSCARVRHRSASGRTRCWNFRR